MRYVGSSSGIATRRQFEHGSGGGGHASGKSPSGRCSWSQRLTRSWSFGINSARFFVRLSLPQWTIAALLALVIVIAQLLATDAWSR